jgi:hypothetical protein
MLAVCGAIQPDDLEDGIHAAAADLRGGSLETTIRCVGSWSDNSRDQRCRYENLYLMEGEFWALSLSPLGEHQVLTTPRNPCEGPACPGADGLWMRAPFVPRERVFRSGEALEQFVHQNVRDRLAGQSILNWALTPQNFGHVVWDELFAGFHSARTLGFDVLNTTTTRVIEVARDIPELRSTIGFKVFERFWGASMHVDDIWSKGGGVRLDSVVAGVGDSGMSWRTSDYLSQFHAATPSLEQFVTRFHRRHGEAPPAAERCPGGVCRVALIRNKRQWCALAEAEHVLRSHGFEVQVLDLGSKGGTHAHLGALSKVDIYVSSVGTAMTAAPFLGRGSVVVNLGWVDGFWDEYVPPPALHRPSPLLCCVALVEHSDP